MLDKILLALGFFGTIFGLAFVQGKRSEKNKQNRNAVKTVKEVKKRDSIRDADDSDVVKQRLRKHSRNG